MHRQPQHGRVERRAIIAISKLMSTRCSGKGFCSLHVSTWSASCCTWIDFVSSSLARVSCSSSSCQSALRRSCHTRFLCRTLKLVSRSNACTNSSTKHQVRTHQCINLTIFLPACLAKWFCGMSTTEHPRYLCVSFPIGITNMRCFLDRRVSLIELSERPDSCASINLHGLDITHIRPGTR